MNATNKTKTTRSKLTLAQRKALCTHTQTIDLSDGVKVCTCCEAVLR